MQRKTCDATITRPQLRRAQPPRVPPTSHVPPIKEYTHIPASGNKLHRDMMSRILPTSPKYRHAASLEYHARCCVQPSPMTQGAAKQWNPPMPANTARHSPPGDQGDCGAIATIPAGYMDHYLLTAAPAAAGPGFPRRRHCEVSQADRLFTPRMRVLLHCSSTLSACASGSAASALQDEMHTCSVGGGRSVGQKRLLSLRQQTRGDIREGGAACPCTAAQHCRTCSQPFFRAALAWAVNGT